MSNFFQNELDQLPLPHYLTKRGDIYYYRRKYPVFVQGLTKRRELKLSLGTRNRQMAERLAKERNAEFEAEVASLIAQLEPSVELQPVELNTANISALGRLYIFESLQKDRFERMQGTVGVEQLSHLSATRAARLSELRTCVAVGDVNPIKDELAHYCKSHGLDFNGPTSLQQALHFEFLESSIRVLEARGFRDRGELVESPAEPTLPWVETEAQKRAGIMNCLYEWRNNNKSRDPKTHDSYGRRSMEFFRFVEGRSYLDVCRDDVLGYRDWLVDVEGRTLKTANNRLGTLITLSKSVLADLPPSQNPFNNVKFTNIGKKSSRTRMALT